MSNKPKIGQRVRWKDLGGQVHEATVRAIDFRSRILTVQNDNECASTGVPFGMLTDEPADVTEPPEGGAALKGTRIARRIFG